MAELKILTARFGTPNPTDIDTYLKDGGYQALGKALKMTQDNIINEVKKSALRGRGGAGFSAGVKWSFVPRQLNKPKYLVCNADESEPGTCKDRPLMELDPHQLIEGMAIGSYALGANLSFIYIRGEYWYIIDILEKAIEQARNRGYLGKNILGSGFDHDIIVHPGAGAYICGEETALLNSLEGKRGHPRIKPPFPAVVGLYGCPTVVNNVETLAAVPHIINKGGDWYRNLGTEKSGGSKMFSLSGHINKPGNYEVPMGYPLMDMINVEGGGMRGGKKLKAVIVGGSSVPIINAEAAAKCKMDYESCQSVGTMLGSGGVIIMDETVDIFETTFNLIRFYNHESCGWCTPCREGTDWLLKIFKKIKAGIGEPSDIDLILKLCVNIEGRSHCPLGEAAVWPITSAIKHFPEDFKKHLRKSLPVLTMAK